MMIIEKLLFLTLLIYGTSSIAVFSSIKVKQKLALRFLESNSWSLQAGDLKFLIDPVFYQLHFGIPSLYRGNKRVIDGPRELYSLSQDLDFILISQGLDDHAHKPTLSRLAQIVPKMKNVVAPSAKPVLESWHKQQLHNHSCSWSVNGNTERENSNRDHSN